MEEVPAIESKTDEPVQLLAELQKELDDLERQWVIEIENYKVDSRRGKVLPEPGDGTIITVLFTIAGLAIMVGSSVVNSKSPHSDLQSIMPLLVGGGMVIFAFSQGNIVNEKADEYVIAKENYQLRHLAIEAKIQAAK